MPELSGGVAPISRTRRGASALSLATLVRRSLIRWAAGWSIGFVLIWMVAAGKQGFAWLWTAGAVMAILSLGLTLLAQWLLYRKIRQTSEKLARLETLLDERDGAT